MSSTTHVAQHGPAEHPGQSATSGCCGATVATPEPAAAGSVPAGAPCCGTAADAQASASCCGEAAKAQAIAVGTGCC